MTWTLHNMDVMDGLALIPDNSVQVCVTSPPYFGLRDYGTATWEGGDPECDHKPNEKGIGSSTLEGSKETTGHRQEGYRGVCPRCGARRVDRQIGLEASLQEYIDKMVAVFEEVRRVLRPDGTLWLNLGDSYAGSWGNYGAHEGGQRLKTTEQFARPGYEEAWRQTAPPTSRQDGLKPKDLMSVPWRVALALQAGFARCTGCGRELRADLWPVHNGHRVCVDCLLAGRPEAKVVQSRPGWWLRSEIVWSKPNPMPESVKDRPTRSHEYVFLMTKSQRYYYDAEAIREKAVSLHPSGNGYVRPEQFKRGGTGSERPWHPVTERNSRTVWTLATQPYKGAHFATFPERLAARCILAGSSPKVCPQCGAGWKRVMEDTHAYALLKQQQRTKRYRQYDKPAEVSQFSSATPGVRAERITTGWQPGCKCEGSDGSGHALVLDPFAGSGTTLYVAEKYGRDSVGIELSPAYCDLVRDRLKTVQVVMDYVGS